MSDKTRTILGHFDVVVIGAGHAGIEAALAAARLGVKVGIFTLSLDAVANMPCNPAIGGPAKSQLVREIDALGGEMAIAADETALQVRMLGMSKGAAVRALRVQTDRQAYHKYMKQVLEQKSNISLKQAEIVDILTEDGKVCGVVNRYGNVYEAKAVIIATGTYLGGKIFIGDDCIASGPDGQHPATELSKNLEKLGVTLRRFKTGTPARIKHDSIDKELLEIQHGEESPFTFSFSPKKPIENKRFCYIAYTDETGHEILKSNLHRSPLYSGNIVGTGPRYCPSIEDKVVRFADKPRHQMFIEPCGLDTQEMYVQGMSTSMPEDVQVAFYRSIKGLEDVEIMRPAYAIEYDCCDSLELTSGLSFKSVKGLFGAGQFNGTSGYEEAAAQGLVAGLNAARYAKNLPEHTFSATDSYIGSMLQDLVTRGTNEPYRMMPSRSEYRLFLRQDNADHRLCDTANELGLLQSERYDAFNSRRENAKRLYKLLKNTTVTPSQINEVLLKETNETITSPIKAIELLRRPRVSIEMLLEHLSENDFTFEEILYVETEIKYEGYIKKQQSRIEGRKKDERKLIPEGFDFSAVTHLSGEAKDKFTRIKPRSVAEAAAIPGINPTDIEVLVIALQTFSANQ